MVTDKEIELLNDIVLASSGDDESACCGAGTFGEYRICEDCGEHC